MKTEHLIDLLAREAELRRAQPWFGAAPLAAATLVSGALVGGFIAAFLSESPHFGHGSEHPAALAPMVTALAAFALAALAFRATAALMRPEAEAPLWPLVVPLAVLLTGVGLELALTPLRLWVERLLGQDPLACFAFVALLSLPVLAGALLALRGGAPADPGRAGAAAGFLASGVASFLYILHCPEDSLLFILAWHVPAVLVAAGLGASIGRRVLRW